MTEREGVGAFQHGVEAVVDTGGVGGAGNYVVLENDVFNACLAHIAAKIGYFFLP